MVRKTMEEGREVVGDGTHGSMVPVDEPDVRVPVPCVNHHVHRPEVTVEAAGETYQAAAVVTGGAERDRLVAEIAANSPFFTDHQARVSRQIPVVALVRNDKTVKAIQP